MKKSVLIPASIALAVGVFSAGVYADGVVKQITAYQNSAIKLKVNGSILDLSDNTGSMDPIIYNGHSYVPAKALGEALGATVQWDSDTSTVVVTGGNQAALPTADNSSSVSVKPSPTPTPTTNLKTTYSSTTSKETFLNDYKAVGGKLLKAYASSLKSGDTSTLESLITSVGYKNNIIDTKMIREDLDKKRGQYSQAVLDKMASQINSAVDSDNLDTSQTRDSKYSLDIVFVASFSSDLPALGKNLTFTFEKDFDSMTLNLEDIFM